MSDRDFWTIEFRSRAEDPKDSAGFIIRGTIEDALREADENEPEQPFRVEQIVITRSRQANQREAQP